MTESTQQPQPVGDYDILEDNRLPDASVRVFRMRKGQGIEHHIHRRSWQLYIVISGLVEIEKDGVVHALEPFGSLGIPPGCSHGARPAGEDVILINVSVPPLRPDDQHPEHDPDTPADMRMPGLDSDIED